MNGTRHTPEQVIIRLREADTVLASGRTVAQMLQNVSLRVLAASRRRSIAGGTSTADNRARKRWDKSEAAEGARDRERPAEATGDGEEAKHPDLSATTTCPASMPNPR